MPFDPSLPPMDNPFAALLAGGGPFGKAGFDGATNPFLQPPSASQQATAPKPPSRLQKLLPLVHLISMWLLLAYFMLWVEPRAGGGVAGVGDENLNFLGGKFWRRWAELGNVDVGGVKHQAIDLYRVHLVVCSFTRYVQHTLTRIVALLLGIHDPPNCFAFVENIRWIRAYLLNCRFLV